MAGRIEKLWRRVTGSESSELRGVARRQQRAIRNLVQAAQKSSANPGYSGTPTNRNEDAANQEYMQALPEVLQRSQDLDVNNPDLRGFHRTRTAQIIGAHVRFKSAPKADEVGIMGDALLKVCSQIDRVRELHSRTGGFDSTGKGRTEGIQQVRAQLTAMIHGSCLIHRVWRPENPILPLSLELIPGVRISTPNDRMGDSKVSYGVEYSDEHRTKVVAYHVRRVAQTRGDSFVPVPIWDRLPIEDCSILEMIEPAGMDRAMPVAVATVTMLRTRGEMINATLSAARAQANIYAAIECAAGQNPLNAAEDDADDIDYDADGNPTLMTRMGDVTALYLNNGEKINWNSAKGPENDFAGFMGYTDERISRGLSSSVSIFTRKVNNSYAGGRLEQQQDDPLVDQSRGAFVSAWQKVNCWVLEAAWISGAVQMPGFSSSTAVFWSEFRAEFPGKVHINPVDTVNAREKGFMLRTVTPQQACEEDGKDLRENMRQWAEADQIRRDTEKEFKLPDGTLNFMITGQPVPATAPETAAGEDAEDGKKPAKPPLRIAGGDS